MIIRPHTLYNRVMIRINNLSSILQQPLALEKGVQQCELVDEPCRCAALKRGCK